MLKEIYTLAYSSDEKYAQLRKQLRSAQEKGTIALVVIVVSAVGAQLSVEADVVAGFCAVAINSVVKLGKEVYCSINEDIYA